MIKFAHVGFPKCASTWLQSQVFSKHSEIFFLGRRPGDNILSNELRTLFWSTFLDAREFAYDKKKTKSMLTPLIQDAQVAHKGAIGLSLEQLLHPHIGRLELSERARRLKHFMDKNTKIIIVIREQSAWIKSYYSNLVSEAGLQETFKEFKDYFFAEIDSSPLTALYYDRVYEVYANLFGAENIYLVPMEQLKNSATKFTNGILNFIGVSPLAELSSTAKNAAASDEHFAAQLYLNNQAGYRLGRSNAVHRAFGWQVRSLYENNDEFDMPQAYYDDKKLYLQNWNIEAFLNDNPHVLNELTLLDRTFTHRELDKLHDLYAQTNSRLEKLCGLDLAQYGYSL